MNQVVTRSSQERATLWRISLRRLSVMHLPLGNLKDDVLHLKKRNYRLQIKSFSREKIITIKFSQQSNSIKTILNLIKSNPLKIYKIISQTLRDKIWKGSWVFHQMRELRSLMFKYPSYVRWWVDWTLLVKQVSLRNILEKHSSNKKTAMQTIQTKLYRWYLKAQMPRLMT